MHGEKPADYIKEGENHAGKGTARLPVRSELTFRRSRPAMRGGSSKVRELTSSANPLLKVFRRALADGVTREGWLAVEGPHLLKEALSASSNGSVQSVLVSRTAGSEFRDLLAQVPKEAEVTQVPDGLFRHIAQTEAPQGIAALVELRTPSLDSVLSQRNTFLLVGCGVQDPGNIGTMIRSAQALGGTALLTLAGTVSPFNPKAARSTAGAIFRLPVVQGVDPKDLFPRLHTARIRIIAADQHSPAPLAFADLTSSVAILIGREGTGLAPEIFREASQLLSIPIHPGTDSLNAASAASIFLYEAARQRGFRY